MPSRLLRDICRRDPMPTLGAAYIMFRLFCFRDRIMLTMGCYALHGMYTTPYVLLLLPASPSTPYERYPTFEMALHMRHIKFVFDPCSRRAMSGSFRLPQVTDRQRGSAVHTCLVREHVTENASWRFTKTRFITYSDF